MQPSTAVPRATAAAHTWHLEHQGTTTEQAVGQQHMMSDVIATFRLLDITSHS